MIKTIRGALIQISSWKTDLRVIMAFALGFVLLCLNGYPYLKFAAFLKSEVQAFELSVICGSTGYAFLALFLGNLLLLSNAPFITDVTTYELLRSGKKQWIDSKILYIVLSSVLYSIMLMVASAVFSAFKGTVSFKNEWSYAMLELAIKQPIYSVDSFRIAFPQRMFVETVNPYTAVVLTVICNSMYSILISMTMMCVNLLSSRNWGWIVASLIHIGGYVIFANAGFMFPQKYSLFCHGMPAYYIQEIGHYSIIGTVCFVLAVFLILREICLFASKRMQV